MLEVWGAVAAFTAIYLYRLNPASGGEWVALVAMSLVWPILMLALVAGMVRKRLNGGE